MTARLALPQLLSHIVDNRGRTCPTVDSGFPLIATNCIRKDRRYPVFENVRHVSEEIMGSWFRSHPTPDDVIFVCKGSPGRVALVPNPTPFAIAQDMVALRADRSVVLPHFLYYSLKAPSTQEFIASMQVGTMIPHFKKGDFGKLYLDVPRDLRTQARIVDILRALDDKIDSNIKSADLVAELSAALFRRSVGQPSSCSYTFGELCEIGGGGTPRTSIPEYWDGSIPWATPTDITALAGPFIRSTSRSLTAEGLAACSSSLYPKNSILMTSRATIGAFAITSRPMAVNQGFIVAKARDPKLHWWIFHEMRSRVAEFTSYANGATFLELGRGKFKNLTVRLADARTMNEFDRNVDALHSCAREGLEQNQTLSTIRDTLLPHLMSGRLKVEDAEKQVEAVV